MENRNIVCPECNHQFALDKVLEKEITIRIENKTREDMAKALSDQAKNLKYEFAQTLSALNGDLEVKQRHLLEAQKNELALRKQSADVEQRAREIDLEIERKLAAQVSSVTERLTKQIAEDFSRKDLEREHLIGEMRRQIVEMKQKTEQGSQQTQGEVFEETIAALLREEFPQDTISDVEKGISGADIVQKIIARSGQCVGSILWEVKQTKTFQPSWLEKLKEDRNAAGADLAVLVSAVLPKGRKGAYLDHGIWIIEPSVVTVVARIARQSILDLHRALVTTTSKKEKADVLYSYLTNPVFRQRLEAIVECFNQMREDLEKEKKVISKNWKYRTRQLDSVVENTLSIYTDIQSVIGQKVFNIELLELPALGNVEVIANE